MWDATLHIIGHILRLPWQATTATDLQWDSRESHIVSNCESFHRVQTNWLVARAVPSIRNVEAFEVERALNLSSGQ